LRQLSGVTINNNTLNIISSPEFLRLQDGLLKIARAHPEVRVELMKLVHNLEAGIEAPKSNGAPLIEGEAAHAD
jgi:hypothetical protein